MDDTSEFDDTEARSRIFDAIRAEMARRASPQWDMDGFDESLSLHDAALGLDSVAVIELLLFCEQQFDVRLPEAFLDSSDKTVGDLITVIAETAAA